MAAIDKIYIGWEDYCAFKEWCAVQPPLYDKYGTETHLISWLWEIDEDSFIDKDGNYFDRPVMNNPYYIDAYIIKNCPIQGVQDAIAINYGYRSQDELREAYETVKKRKPEIQELIDKAGNKFPSFPEGTPVEDKYYWYWKSEDFEIDENGHISLKNEEKSTYEEIRDGDIEFKAKACDYVPGKHFTMINSPKGFGLNRFEKPFHGIWFVEVHTPEEYNDYGYMWYHNYPKNKKRSGTWDFSTDFVADAEWSSSCATVSSIRALKRMIPKWKLPIGTKVTVNGRYQEEKYEFIVKK